MSETFSMHMMIYRGSADEMDEFYCPFCGRHVFISWPPDFRKKVISEGDSSIVHGGATGDVSVCRQTIEQSDPFAEFIDQLDVGRKLDDTCGE